MSDEPLFCRLCGVEIGPEHTREDPRKTGLKNGLRQLTAAQIQKVIDWPYELVLDVCNYEDGKFCPLAVGVGLPETLATPSQEKVYDALIGMGLSVYNTRGIAGAFYTTNRKEDLLLAAREVLAEKLGLENFVGG